MTHETALSQASQKHRRGEGCPLANGINSNAFLALAQVASREEMERINQAVELELKSAPDQWTKAERKRLAERINDPQTASLRLAILLATTDPCRFDDQSKLLAPGVGNNRCSVIVAASHPFSKGSIHVQDNDASHQPIFDP